MRARDWHRHFRLMQHDIVSCQLADGTIKTVFLRQDATVEVLLRSVILDHDRFDEPLSSQDEELLFLYRVLLVKRVHRASGIFWVGMI
jgi:hypothetical protein